MWIPFSHFSAIDAEQEREMYSTMKSTICWATQMTNFPASCKTLFLLVNYKVTDGHGQQASSKKMKFHISPSRKKGFSWFVKKSGNRVNKVLWSFQKIYFHGKKATKSDGWKREDAQKKLRKASLPWDFLCVPKKTFFLLRIAMNKDLILVRSKKYLILDLFDFYSSFSCLRSTWSHKTHHFQLTNDGCRTEG